MCIRDSFQHILLCPGYALRRLPFPCGIFISPFSRSKVPLLQSFASEISLDFVSDDTLYPLPAFIPVPQRIQRPPGFLHHLLSQLLRRMMVSRGIQYYSVHICLPIRYIPQIEAQSAVLFPILQWYFLSYTSFKELSPGTWPLSAYIRQWKTCLSATIS